jgi:hypothetical protein
MANVSISNLYNAFATGKTPTGDDFKNLIDSTYGFPTSAGNYNIASNLTLTQSNSGLPVILNGVTYYLPLFRAS